MVQLLMGTVGLIALHEAGHVATARGLGYRAELRIRLKPIPHPTARVYFPTVAPRRDDVLIALGGPLASILVGAGLLMAGLTMLGVVSITEMGLLSLLPFRYFDGYRLRHH